MIFVGPISPTAYARHDFDAREGRWRKTAKGWLAQIMPDILNDAGGDEFVFSSFRKTPPKRPEFLSLPQAGADAITTIYLPTGRGLGGASLEYASLTYYDDCVTPIPGEPFFPFLGRSGGLRDKLAQHLNPITYDALRSDPYKRFEVWLRPSLLARQLAPGVFKEPTKCKDGIFS